MTSRSSDFRDYFSVRNVHMFQVSWGDFYRRGLELTREFRKNVSHEIDIPYGPSAFQHLDIYLPERMTAETPCFAFFHGGAFREGHPAQYGFMAKPYVDRGAAFTAISSRQAPEAYFPDHVQDVAAFMQWAHANLPKFGLDARRMVVSGHSSGSTMVALASVRSDWQKSRGLGENILDSVVLAGASYDYRHEFPQNLVPDKSRRLEATAVCNIKRVPRHAIVYFSRNEVNSGDPSRYSKSGRELAAALKEHGSDVHLFELEGTHVDTCLALCDDTGKWPIFDAVMQALAGTPKSK
jgi:arylformamidase